MPKTVWRLVVVASLFVALGCGGRGSRGVHVKGEVTLDGQALAGASVIFSSASFQTSGVTGPEGKYELTQDPPPGDYRVSISKIQGMVGGPSVSEGVDAFQMETAAAASAADPKAPKGQTGPKQLVPSRYSDPAHTTLSCKVPEGGPAEANFRLTTQ